MTEKGGNEGDMVTWKTRIWAGMAMHMDASTGSNSTLLNNGFDFLTYHDHDEAHSSADFRTLDLRFLADTNNGCGHLKTCERSCVRGRIGLSDPWK